jgi:CubicO group peptidase (beta-lactamase class C family)
VPKESLELLRDRIQEWISGDRLVGAELLVIKNRLTVLHEAYGWKDREAEVRMEPNTLFNIRSMTKPLVGTVARILVEDEVLSLDQPVADFLPSFRRGDSRSITVGQLLGHFSGLPVTQARTPEDPPTNLQDHAAATGEAGPRFEPGSRFWYSDAGFDVLGAVLEAATGQPLDELLTHRLFEPLGMEGTGYFTRTTQGDLPRNRIAALYGGSRGAWQRFWQPTDSPFYPFPMGSQGVYSTPSDYARFLALWLDAGQAPCGRILPEVAVQEILTPAAHMTPPGSGTPFPTGFPDMEVWHGEMSMLWMDAHSPQGTPRIVGYFGSDGTFAWAWPEEDLMVLLFSQSRGQDVHLEVEAVLNRLFMGGEGAKAQPSPSPNPQPDSVSSEARPYIGRYQADFGPHKGQEFTVLVQDGMLAVDIPGQAVFTLREPDEEGWRPFTLTDQVAVRFREESTPAPDAGRKVRAMELAQTSVFPKQSEPDSVPEVVPPELQALLGDYLLPGNQGSLSVTFRSNVLTMTDPRGMVTPLTRAEVPGLWSTDETPPKQISFPLDPSGDVTAMSLRETVVLPKIDPEKERLTAVVQAYAQGLAAGDPALLDSILHQDFHRVQVRREPSMVSDYIAYTTRSSLLHKPASPTQLGSEGPLEADMEILELCRDLAVARIESSTSAELLHLARFRGDWLVVNALWSAVSPERSGAEESPLSPRRATAEPDGNTPVEASMGYIEGAFSGDARRMARALHPEMNKVWLRGRSETGGKFLSRMGATDLIETTRTGAMILPESQWEIHHRVLYTTPTMAAVRVTSSQYVDHLLLSLVDGEWKIMNVIWIPNVER